MVAVRASYVGSRILATAIRDIQSKKLRVGWFDTARYQDGTPVAYIAAIQEFGHGAIPPRPFMRPTIEQQRQAWRDTLRKGVKQVLAERLTFEQMLTAFGLSAAGEVAESIKAVTAPPLSPITLLLRQRAKTGEKITGRTVGMAAAASGFVPTENAGAALGVSEKPLIDTALMFQSVTAQVSDE